MVQVCLPFGVSTWCRCAGFRGIQDLQDCWLWSSGRVLPPFCPLYCFALGALSLNMALFRVFRAFLARFGVVVWVYVGLVLFVACVAFCARVELGGLKTCGVFAPIFRFSSSFVLS